MSKTNQNPPPETPKSTVVHADVTKTLQNILNSTKLLSTFKNLSLEINQFTASKKQGEFINNELNTGVRAGN